jgi:hypothetical protein
MRMNRKPLSALVALLSAFTICDITYAATCYQDDSGRIVQRRRPGMKQVECPGDAPAAAPAAQKISPPAGSTLPRGSEPRRYDRRAPAGAVVDQMPSSRPLAPRSPNPVSVVPRPKLQDYENSIPVPDRWRIVDALGYEDNWWDPYHRNTLKADKPVHGEWFFNLGIISDTVYEKRKVPTPIGASSSGHAGASDIFGGTDQWALNQNLALEFVYYKGDTTFRPPDYEFRFIPVINYNYVELEEVQGVNVDPDDGKTRSDDHVGIQTLFADIHLRNVSVNYDFDSFRFGIQPFSADFRGFLFQDSPVGLRLFGNRHNNVFQYNLAVFRRIEKDTNSGLNDVGEDLRDDDIVFANLFWQDLFVKGFTSQFSITYNRNNEDDEAYFDKNGFIARPASIGDEKFKDYDVFYLGYSGDGHFGSVNLSTSVYSVFGEQSRGLYYDDEQDVSGFFAAAELSMDFDWARWKLSMLYGSGDDDPFDDEAVAFDAIQENPQFAGADTSYWIRQAVPLIGGGRVALAGRNGVLNSLRSSKDEGQSNFENPGIVLVGIGGDFDVLPELRLSFNWNWLQFDDTTILEVARNQGDIDKDIGQDVSVSATWRPFMSQNIVLRGSYAVLLAGDGYEALFDDDDPDYLLLNLILAY